MNSAAKKGLIGLLIILCIAGSAWYWHNASKVRSTDNAYINADIVRVGNQVTGQVVKVNVKEGELVKAGQVLFEIDPAPFEVSLKEAQAKLALARQGHNEDSSDVLSARAVVAQNEADPWLLQLLACNWYWIAAQKKTGSTQA